MDHIPMNAARTAAVLLALGLAGMRPVSAQVDGAPIHPWAQPSPPVVYMVGPMGVPQGYVWTGNGWYPVAAGYAYPARSGAVVRTAPEQRAGVVVPRSDVVMGWGGATTAGYGTSNGTATRR